MKVSTCCGLAVLLLLAVTLLPSEGRQALAETVAERAQAHLEAREEDDDVGSEEDEGASEEDGDGEGEGQEDDEGSDEDGGDGESSDSPDAVDKLVGHILAGKPVKWHGNSNGGATIALGNHNEIKKDTSSEEEKSDEAAIKKNGEAGKKSHVEQQAKVQAEERLKKVALEKSKVKAEEDNKKFDDQLKLKSERAKKSGKEEYTKSQEQAEKALAAVARAAARQKAANERAEQIAKKKQAAMEKKHKQTIELAKKKAAEEIKKTNAEAAAKRRAAERKAKAEAAAKKRAETARKKAAERAAKKRAEQNKKNERSSKERSAKYKKKLAEQRKKRYVRSLYGRWCYCSNHRIYFNHNNRWHLCPSNKLLIGLYRGNHHYLNYIYYYKCCRPCRHDGRSALGVTGCRTAHWNRSFDRTGWSWCPGNHYVQGFYKSSCNWIYCLEYARCCRINGSRGYKSCRTRGAWGRSLDRTGWSVLTGHRFMRGLYRSGGHYLYNIEYAHECLYYQY